MPAKFKLFIFRITSSRGTDFRRAVKLRPDITRKEVLEVADDWSERETAGTACREYTVSVRSVKPIQAGPWQKKWTLACKRYRKAKDARDDLSAIRTPLDYTKEY